MFWPFYNQNGLEFYIFFWVFLKSLFWGVLLPRVKNYYDTGLTVPDSEPMRVTLVNAYFQETKCNNSRHFQLRISCDTLTEKTSWIGAETGGVLPNRLRCLS